MTLNNYRLPVAGASNYTLKASIFFLTSLTLFTQNLSYSQTPEKTAQAQTTIVLNTFARPPLSNPFQTGMADLIFIEAFKRLGMTVTIVHLPAERALINANKGIDDGDFVRVGGLSKLYPNLIQVPEKIMNFEFVAFSRKTNIRTESWESLKPYSIGIIRGWKILEENVVGASWLTQVADPYLLFTLIENDRADIILYERLEGYGMIKEMEMDDVKALEPPLVTREMFLYLHKKHSALSLPLAKTLRKMKMDGSYVRIISKSLKSYLPKEDN
ncbi:MAG TPA: transporter substrate-binding domain-containing protein [Nitrospirae bacterium]|nr:transporter substrate-binding domain-containing protein [Nitrospirota bacterium]